LYNRLRSCSLPSFKYEGNIYTIPQDICNAFSSKFKSNFSPRNLNTHNLCFPKLPNIISELNSIIITEQDVVDSLLLIKENFSSGPDKIPAIVLKKCAASLSYSLCSLFNYSLRVGAIPKV
jgi:hypothetical protein